MIKPQTNLCILEDRPLLSGALKSTLQEVCSGPVFYYRRFEELPKKMPAPAILFLAVHLLPVDEPIPSGGEGVASVVYGEHFTLNCVDWWLDRGARGVWDLVDGFETIQNGVVGALEGKMFKSPSVEKLFNGTEHRHGMHLLSRRELQVAKRLVRGNSTREVAKELGVTEGTIKNQRKAVYRKLGIVRSSQLPLAMGNGFAALRS